MSEPKRKDASPVVRRAIENSESSERLARCAIVIGYDVEQGDAYVIKDLVSGNPTGRVSIEHALKRFELARLQSAVSYEASNEEGLDK